MAYGPNNQSQWSTHDKIGVFQQSNVIIQEKEKIQIKTQSRGPHLADRLHFILKQVFENTKDTSNHLGLLGKI